MSKKKAKKEGKALKSIPSQDIVENQEVVENVTPATESEENVPPVETARTTSKQIFPPTGTGR